MYTFLLHYYRIDTDTEDSHTIQVDSTPIDCTERDIFIMAMDKAFNYCRFNNVEFCALEFISC